MATARPAPQLNQVSLPPSRRAGLLPRFTPRRAEDLVVAVGGLRMVVLVLAVVAVCTPSTGDFMSSAGTAGWILSVAGLFGVGVSGILLRQSVRDRRFHPAATALEAVFLLVSTGPPLAVAAVWRALDLPSALLLFAIASVPGLISLAVLIALRRLPSRGWHVPRKSAAQRR